MGIMGNYYSLGHNKYLLEQRYQWASTISGAIIALVGAMLLSNFKVIPTSAPVYDTVWDYIVPLSIPLLLFSSNILKFGKKVGDYYLFFNRVNRDHDRDNCSFYYIKSFSTLFIKNRGNDDWKLHWWGVNFAALSSKLKRLEKWFHPQLLQIIVSWHYIFCY